ncbi:killer cell lectin-like receptor 5 [Arvicanthis niloticus]|uniref:killer cell lectin-like receptor 5 n=1 Tax=Arvicanthis niloticus TaxID=61156 RepID=UPI001486ABE6|nr:killer cell lectin-like receptor 5 [Arvicanthis niloticus]
MSEQEVTYSTVRFHKSSGLQNQGRPEETQRPKKAAHRECSVPWQLIVTALGTLCFLLLVTVAVLAIHIFQCIQQKPELQEPLNRLHNCSTIQCDTDSMEERLRNMCVECRRGNDLLKCPNRKENRWYIETKAILNSPQCTGKGEIHWFCYGIKCYYFINNDRKWNGCKQTCHNFTLSLLKIDDEDELRLLKCQIIQDSYWIGLKYDPKIKEWAWIENDTSKLDLVAMKSERKTGDCAFFSMTGIHNDDCGRRHPCICEKRMDKVPESVCSVKERSQSAV